MADITREFLGSDEVQEYIQNAPIHVLQELLAKRFADDQATVCINIKMAEGNRVTLEWWSERDGQPTSNRSMQTFLVGDRLHFTPRPSIVVHYSSEH